MALRSTVPGGLRRRAGRHPRGADGQGETVEVTLDPIAINGAGVAIPDVLATNGVVHVIDAVLTPPEGL